MIAHEGYLIKHCFLRDLYDKGKADALAVEVPLLPAPPEHYRIPIWGILYLVGVPYPDAVR